MVETSTKENSGIFILNPSPAGEEVSVLVTGLGRSGTTMVSRVLSALGLFMGERVSKGTNEDKDFRNIIKSGSLPDFTKLCRERDDRFKRWGFKYPGARHNLSELVAAMRSPRVVVTSRDAVATVMRAGMATRAEVLPLVDQAWRTLRLFESVERLHCPVLLLSYEKAISRPRNCTSALANFCGIDADEEMIETAAGKIRNGDQVYLS